MYHKIINIQLLKWNRQKERWSRKPVVSSFIWLIWWPFWGHHYFNVLCSSNLISSNAEGVSGYEQLEHSLFSIGLTNSHLEHRRIDGFFLISLSEIIPFLTRIWFLRSLPIFLFMYISSISKKSFYLFS